MKPSTTAVGWAPPMSRQVVNLSRSVGQEVRNAGPGCDVDRLRDPIVPNEGQKPLSGLETRNTAGVDRSVHCGRHSSEIRPPARQLAARDSGRKRTRTSTAV